MRVILSLTNGAGYTNIQMKTYSTIQVAKLLGIASGTFHRWIREKRVQAPSLQSVLGMNVRAWTEVDIQKVRKYKDEHYWGRGGRKKRKKRTK